MDIQQLMIAISDCQKELTQTLVDGVEGFPEYKEIIGKINGLEISKHIIQKSFEESTQNDGSTEEDSE